MYYVQVSYIKLNFIYLEYFASLFLVMALKPVYKARVVKKRTTPFVRFESDRHKRVKVWTCFWIIVWNDLMTRLLNAFILYFLSAELAKASRYRQPRAPQVQRLSSDAEDWLWYTSDSPSPASRRLPSAGCSQRQGAKR